MELMMSHSTASATLLVGALLFGTDASASPMHSAVQSKASTLAVKQRSNAQTCSAWAERQLAELMANQESWDNYDADPVRPKTVSQLRAILCAARSFGEHTGHIVPGADGSLQAEWHLEQMTVGALVEDDGSFSAWALFRDNKSQVEEFGFSSIDFLKSLAVAYRLDV